MAKKKVVKKRPLYTRFWFILLCFIGSIALLLGVAVVTSYFRVGMDDEATVLASAKADNILAQNSQSGEDETDSQPVNLSPDNPDSSVVGRWELVRVANMPEGGALSEAIEFFADGSGRRHHSTIAALQSDFTWQTEENRMSTTGSSLPYWHYTVEEPYITFIYDRESNFYAVYRRTDDSYTFDTNDILPENSVVGMWELVSVANMPEGGALSEAIEFFADGTGRRHHSTIAALQSDFTWHTEENRMSTLGSSLPYWYYMIDEPYITFIYDSESNFYSVYRRTHPSLIFGADNIQHEQDDPSVSLELDSRLVGLWVSTIPGRTDVQLELNSDGTGAYFILERRIEFRWNTANNRLTTITEDGRTDYWYSLYYITFGDQRLALDRVIIRSGTLRYRRAD